MSRRVLLERALLVGALWLLGGGIGLVAGVAFVVYDLVSRPAPRDLLVIAVLLLGLAPLVVLARGLPAAAAVGPGFVEGNLVGIAANPPYQVSASLRPFSNLGASVVTAVAIDDQGIPTISQPVSVRINQPDTAHQHG